MERKGILGKPVTSCEPERSDITLDTKVANFKKPEKIQSKKFKEKIVQEDRKVYRRKKNCDDLT